MNHLKYFRLVSSAGNGSRTSILKTPATALVGTACIPNARTTRVTSAVPLTAFTTLTTWSVK
jgi:hypothetical protein